MFKSKLINHVLHGCVVLGASTIFSNSVAQQSGAGSTEGVLEEIVVTGSRIGRVAADTGELPIQFISEDRFELMSPAESVAEFLQKLPEITGFNNDAILDEYGGGKSSINMRGLGPQYTLVLVDGRRLGGENTPDVGAIPAEAVAGVEILKAGASAVYGSDAVTGVVNIRLKDNFKGIEFVGSYGEATRGGGENLRLASVFGLQKGPLSFTGSVAWQDDEGFQKYQREITTSRDLRPLGGLDRRSGYMTDPHVFYPYNGGEYTMDLGRFGPGDIVTGFADLVPKDDSLRMSGQQIAMQPPQDRLSGHWSLNYAFAGDRVNFFAHGYADRRNRSMHTQPSISVVQVAADNPNNPLGVGVEAFYLFSPTIGSEIDDLMRIDSDILNVQGTFGFEGSFNDRLNWEVSYTKYWDDRDYLNINDIEVSLAQAAVDSGEFNPLCVYCNSMELRDQISVTTAWNIQNDLDTIDLMLSGDLFDIGDQAVQFAAGYQHRDVSFADTPSQEAQDSTFWWFGTFGGPGSGDRQVDAFFGEFRVPLYESDSASFIQSAEISAAIRTEDYSDFGSATVPQAFGLVRFMDGQMSLRAGFAETFRAPSVEDLTDPTNQSRQPGLSIFDPQIGEVVTVVDIINGGNPDLDAEEGETYNVGLIIQPNRIPDLLLTVDWWNTTIENVIRSPDIEGLFTGSETAGSIERDTPDGVPLVDLRVDNGGELEAGGIDFGANYNLKSRAGDFSMFANATYLTTFEERAASETLEHVGHYSTTFFALPEWRAVAGTSWTLNNFDGSLVFNYMGSVKDIVAGTDINRNTDSYETVDLQIGYNLADFFSIPNARIYLGADNVFDAETVFLAESTDGVLTNTLLGRYVYGGFRVQF